MQDTEFRVSREPFSPKEIQLYIRHGQAYASVQFKEIEEGYIISPALSITPHEAQALMDELWRSGLRPTEGTGSAGSLAATQEHLADMKKIAFSQLKIKTL